MSGEEESGGRCQQLPWLLAELTFFLSSPPTPKMLKKPKKNEGLIQEAAPTLSFPKKCKVHKGIKAKALCAVQSKRPLGELKNLQHTADSWPEKSLD